MPSSGLDTSAFSSPWQQIEIALLSELRRAEAEFKQASAEQKEEAGERYRIVLEQFSHVVLDRRFPPGWNSQS